MFRALLLLVQLLLTIGSRRNASPSALPTIMVHRVTVMAKYVQLALGGKEAHAVRYDNIP